ncbi:MAG: hypothetical protein M3N42_06515 [Cyanobacteriota bacterium]|nr:hypothetical protein [Cyanobacteriota bacterium]
MSHIDDCPAGRSQFLTRGSLFKVHAAKVYVLDCITHGTALEILSRASAACRFKSSHTAVLDHQWREYFGLPVMSLSAVAKYYGLKVSELQPHIRKKNTYAGGLFESGMLVLRGAALEFARFMGHTAEIQQSCVLLPPRAVLSLCLSLRPVPAVAATLNAFWDYVLAQKLHESTCADWHYIFSQHVEIECKRIEEQRLLQCLAFAKERKLYPYIQHFGHQTCFEAWASLFAYEGEFPPPRGSFYVERQDWFDRVSHISLWR